MKKIFLSFIVLIVFCSVSFAEISSSDTNYPVIQNSKGIYGKNTSGLGKQLIGINSSNKVSIDSDATGVVFGSGVTFSSTVAGITTLGVTTISATSIAGTLSTAAQTSITSVGTLSSLTTSGKITVRDISLTGIEVSSPNTATSINIAVTTSIAIIAPYTTVATLNVVLPASASNGQIINILASEAVTELLLTSGDGSIENAVTALTADTCVAYIYVSSKTKWYRFK